jgi:transposase IS116/IS110/IS902 family protein
MKSRASYESVQYHFDLLRERDAARYEGAPKKYQSGEKDVAGGITRTGDEMVRTALYAAANVLLSRIARFSKLKRWGMDVAKRLGQFEDEFIDAKLSSSCMTFARRSSLQIMPSISVHYLRVVNEHGRLARGAPAGINT